LKNNTTGKKDPYAALRFPEFRQYIISRFSIIFALNMQATIVGWKIYEITKDPLSLGLIGLAELIPAMGLALFAGHFVDKYEKRDMLLRCVYGYVFCGAAYLFITSVFASRHFTTQLIVMTLYGITFLGGIVRAFSGPASFSLMSLVVPRELYPNGSTWSSSAWQSGAVLGPLLGGFMYATVGVGWTFFTVVIFHVIAIASLYFIRHKPVYYERKFEHIWGSLGEGINFVFQKKEILSALSLDLFAVLFGGAVALLPVYADKILHVGPEGLGVLRAAPSIGSCVTLLMLAFVPLDKKPGIKLLIAVFGFGLSIIVFGYSTSFLLSIVALFFSGVFDGVSVVIRNTILQLKTPDSMRGRVSAVHSMFVGSSNEFGAFESGVTANWMGTVPAVIFGGCMTLVVVLTTYVVSPALRKLQLK
jgi:MFS family permease